MMKRHILFSLALLLFLGASPLAAQYRGGNYREYRNTNYRHGLWGGFGLGVGSIGCEDCDRLSGFSGMAMLGGTVSRDLRVAAAAHGFSREENDATLEGGTFSLLVQYYPSASDFFMTAGVGVASFTAEIDTPGFNTSNTETGAGLVLGLGYDIPISRRGKLALTPFANWVVTSLDDTIEFVQFGLGLTFN